MKKTFSTSCAVISHAYEVLHAGISSAEDLKRYGLTLSDYYAALDIMDHLRKPGSSAETFISAVADFFQSFGFTVIQRSVNFEISI